MNDIEVLEKRVITLRRHIKNYEESDCKTNIYQQLVKECQAIENLLKERQSDKERIKELEEINEVHKKENGELREELESVKEIYYTQNRKLVENSIPKSLIKEKIEPVINNLERDGFVGYADELRDISEELLKGE